MNGKGDNYRKVDDQKYRQNHDAIFGTLNKKTEELKTTNSRDFEAPIHPCIDCPKDDTCGTPCTALALHAYRIKRRSHK